MKKYLLFLILLFTNNISLATEKAIINDSDNSQTEYFPGFIIHEENQTLNITKLKQDAKSSEASWRIQSKMFQGFITEDDCYDAVAEHCDSLVGTNSYKSCTYPCLYKGPEFLEFAKKSKKIYFLNQLGIGGTGSAPAMLFIADPHLKYIKKICLTDLFISDQAISPNESTLAIALTNHTPSIQLIRESDNINFKVRFPKPSVFKLGESYNVDKDPKYYITALKWLDENHLQFNEEKFENKWSDNPLMITQKILEIDFQNQTGKVIHEKILKTLS